MDDHLSYDDYLYNPAPQYDLYIDYASDLPDVDLTDAEIYDLAYDTAMAEHLGEDAPGSRR